ncbi:MAG: hypothetical protein US40_C0004G0090 [Candidatus Roizmanbacteria bacterium GW2011_GWC2_37_13]|uniref:Uncharacterized protein n=1 Tax=Candidatus Roizmanbacteria bacterium GW2011_GWC2_37_13 TaxID=1618486 RepID=A0A0G0GIW7_9BACT|nr:MAG: hypothetical protein US38_C0001G0077 [Candidatus Roizmanbacteria bacterium GW2011_GWC1_37_12]KKQ26055.1 MAG: hypothetical protein US40_C0004G0090 [Candidatus Roizmanbacteria bacterium GW2011_GWC2_37_13]
MIIIDINGNKRDCVSIIPDNSWPGYLKIKYFSKFRKTSHEEWYLIKDFIKNNPKLAHLTKGGSDPWKEDLGVVSLSSNQTLTDKSKKWKSNEFAGYPLWISRGKGEGQTRGIIMNTNDTLIIDKPWKIIPDKSSQYVISHNVHDPQILGNTLPVDYKIKRVKKKKKSKLDNR